MQWSIGRPFAPPGLVDRLRLRRAAIRYAAHGWAEGAVRWAVAPRAVRWQLPDAATVQAMLVDAFTALGRRPGKDHAERPIIVPRQVSTSRRAV